MKIKNIGKNTYRIAGDKCVITIKPGEVKEVPDASGKHHLQHFPDDFGLPPVAAPKGEKMVGGATSQQLAEMAGTKTPDKKEPEKKEPEKKS